MPWLWPGYGLVNAPVNAETVVTLEVTPEMMVSKEVAKGNGMADRQKRIKAKAEALVTKGQVTKVVTKNCGYNP